VAVEPHLGGQADRGEQNLVFGFQPGHRLQRGGEAFGRNARQRRGDSDPVALRAEQEGRVMSGLQVMIQHPANGRIAIDGSAGDVSLLGGVGAEQVVKGIPALRPLGDQVGAGECVQCLPGLAHRDRCQAGGSRGGDIGARVQAEQAEHQARFGAKLLGGPAENSAEAGGFVSQVEDVETALGIAQLGCQCR
jgi:hypothetical protein